MGGTNGVPASELAGVNDFDLIEGTSRATDTIFSTYPDHLFDPTRREIAAGIIGKEVAKLIGGVDNDRLAELQNTAYGWFDGLEAMHPPVREFWSLFELLQLVKNKRLSRFVTASNVHWEREERGIDEIQLNWMPFLEVNSGFFGTKPWQVGEVRKVFEKHPQLYEEAQLAESLNLSHYGFDRSEDPVTIVQLPNEDTRLLDGNSRIYGALMSGQTQHNLWVGYMEDEQPYHYWVSSGILKDLCYQVLDNLAGNVELSNAALTTLLHHISTNSSARANYNLWLRKDFPELEEVLFS